ncbi:venom peptide SjAPI [Bombyx mori]
MEMTHAAIFSEKDQEKKYPFVMNCERPHERYEACFAGCASVTCDNPRDRLRPCYPFCEPGCICVHPYVRDDRTHKCVLPEDCTKGLKGIPDLGDDR